MAGDNRAHTLSVIKQITLSIQSLNQQVFMEYQLCSPMPGALENTWQAQNRPMFHDFMRRLGKQVQQEK